MVETGQIEKWLKRLVLAGMALLLCMLSLFAWRLSVLVQRLNDSVDGLSADVNTLTTKASEIASHVGGLGQKLADIESVAGKLLDPRRVIDELRSEEAAAGDSAAQSEIHYLLDCIGEPGLSYQYGGSSRSATWVQTKLWIKYQALHQDSASAEDFIRDVASKTLDNETYYVIDKNGAKQELGAFLTDALTKHRSIKAGGS